MDTKISVPSPWLAIWTRPRRTIRRVVDSDPRRQVILLAVLGGFIHTLYRAQGWHVGDRFPFLTILVFCAMAGLLLGIVSLYLMGGLLSWSGSVLDGRASSVEVRGAIAWSQIPMVWSFIPWAIELALFGNSVFMSSYLRIDAMKGITADTSLLFMMGLVGVMCNVAKLIAIVWGTIISLQCLGEVHGFSAWKALGALLLGLFVIALPIFCLVLFVASVSGLLKL